MTSHRTHGPGGPRLNVLASVIVCLTPVLVLGFFLRAVNVGSTALEPDESANLAVAMAVLKTGIPSLKPEVGQLMVPYLFHPPFGFELLAVWFRVVPPGVTSARLLSVAASMLVLLLVFLVLRRFGSAVAVVGTLFVALDCWIILINRLTYLENILLIPILAGIWLLHSANATRKVSTYALAGLAIGLAIVFKHIAIYVAIGALASWLVVRKDRAGYAWMTLMIAIVVIAYTLGMYARFGDVFIDQELVQFGRLIGTAPARGMRFGPVDAFQIIVDRYWIFLTTVVTLVLGWPYVAYRFAQALRAQRAENVVLLCWAFAGLLFAVASQLKSPHYLVLWLVPLYMYLAVEFIRWARGKRKFVIPALVSIFVLANVLTWNYRLAPVTVDPLREAAAYLNERVPSNAVVATETYIGLLIQQPYMRVDTVTRERLTHADYVAYYSSSTAKIEDLPQALQDAIDACAPLATFEGFKDKVTVCKVATAQ